VEVQNTGYNLFQNAALLGVEGNDVPFWEVGGAGVTVSVLPAERLPNHQVLQLEIPAGVLAYFRPNPLYRPAFLDPYLFDRCSFGAYVKTDQTECAYTSINAPAGLTTSQSHPADGEWHLVGMTGFVNKTGGLDPRFWFDNSSNGSPTTVCLTTPTFSFGLSIPQQEAQPINSSGGIMNGTLSTAMTTVSSVPANGYLVLKKEGNVIEIAGTQALHRITHSGAARFPKWTIIHLLFDDAGLSVTNGVYISLRSSYTSMANSSLTLVANGNGTWRELSRNL
jgi:hypothetical protein